MKQTQPSESVLLTGATGFIGSHLYPLLVQHGYDVRCATRNPERASKHWPEQNWVYLDTDDPYSIRRAMRDCQYAYYLIHHVNQGQDYELKEMESAMAFADAAAACELERIVYLGGTKPQTPSPSRHLRSRLVTGSILRAGEVPAIELRAAMIIGEGSASWQILRDIAVRLPLIISPAWLRNRMQPVAMDDVLDALVAALKVPCETSACFDIPGPEVLSFQECILRTARAIGHQPYVIPFPLLTVRLSSAWLRFVTRADTQLSRELVEGLRHDILAENDEYWTLIGHEQRIDFDHAVRRALQTPTQAQSRFEKSISRFYRQLPA